MTKEEFIKKWVVAYESKEQQIEFANEMKADLDGLITAENTRLREALKSIEKVAINSTEMEYEDDLDYIADVAIQALKPDYSK